MFVLVVSIKMSDRISHCLRFLSCSALSESCFHWHPLLLFYISFVCFPPSSSHAIAFAVCDCSIYCCHCNRTHRPSRTWPRRIRRDKWSCARPWGTTTSCRYPQLPGIWSCCASSAPTAPSALATNVCTGTAMAMAQQQQRQTCKPGSLSNAFCNTTAVTSA
jgi:hypothetical protein